MKTAIVVALSSILAASAGAENAAQSPQSRWSTFFNNFLGSLGSSAVAGQRKAGSRASAVAAVRGAQQENKEASDPGTPGQLDTVAQKKQQRQNRQELEFAKALDIVSSGDTAKGLAALEAFKKANPKFFRAQDLDDAIAAAKSLQEAGVSMPAAPAEDAAVDARKNSASPATVRGSAQEPAADAEPVKKTE